MAMQALYQTDISSVGIEEALKSVHSDEKAADATKEESSVLARGVFARLKEIDDKISSKLAQWPIDRLGSVDRNIIRVAAYEMFNVKKDPLAVIINESVELAGKFSSEDSPAFVNGVLGSLAEELKAA